MFETFAFEICKTMLKIENIMTHFSEQYFKKKRFFGKEIKPLLKTITNPHVDEFCGVHTPNRNPRFFDLILNNELALRASH